MNRVFALLNFCVEVCRNPGKVPEFAGGWGVPLTVWLLSGIFFFLPAGFFLGSYYTAGLVILLPLAILGPVLMAILWVYSWIVFYVLARAFKVQLEGEGLLKLVGICMSPLFLGGLLNILVALIFFRAPLAPNFIVMVASLGYFVYCVVKALQAELKDASYVVGFLYVLISLILWFTVKV